VNLTIGHDLLSLWLREDRQGADEPLSATWIGSQGLDEDTPPQPGHARPSDTPPPAGRAAPRPDDYDFLRELREVVAESTPIKVAIVLAVAVAIALVIALGTG
jgi:hypothetical protein